MSLAKRWVEAGNRVEFLKNTLDKVKERFYLDEDRRREVYFEVDSNAIGNMEYYVLIFLSCIIATLGLLNNSAAVIIGAMIVAPLMNPTMGVAMGVVRGDIVLLWRALKTLILGVFISILIACITSFLIPNITDVADISEVMSRTSPNILDIVIALAAGAAGAFALSRKKVASSLAGVAIAVSLMPPLAVTGIGLCLLLKTLKEPHLIQNLSLYLKIFAGSFTLCFTNLVAMNMSGIIVFTVFGFGVYHQEKKKKFRFHFLISALLLALMTFILTGFYTLSLENKRVENNINHILNSEVARLDSMAKIQGNPKIESDLMKIYKEKQIEKIEKATALKTLTNMIIPLEQASGIRYTKIQVTILCPYEPDESYAFKLRALLEEKIGPVDLTLRFVNTTNMNIR